MPGGHVVRDAAGRAEGLLQETAMQVVERALRPEPVTEWIANIATGVRAVLAVGLTSVTEPGIGVTDGIGNGPCDLDAYLRVRERGELGVRMTVMPYITVVCTTAASSSRAPIGTDWTSACAASATHGCASDPRS
ncbi:hypothetical protein [Streptomyces flaveolus]|uniref:hypothetical protein n=1 Tax=Streptomyces flaveolus TaxID=67297 RepID=UPI00370190D0